MAEQIRSGIVSINEPQTPAFNAGVPLPEPGPLTATALAPAEAEWGGPDVECHIAGTGFTREVTVTVDGYDAASIWHSPTDISVLMLASQMTAAGVAPVIVKRGEEETEPLDFEFVDPPAMRGAEHEGKHKGHKKPEPKTKHSWR